MGRQEVQQYTGALWSYGRGMSTGRTAVAGATRTCPHCRTLILDSSTMCPQCSKYLRFDSTAGEEEATGFSALKIEGTLRHPGQGNSLEYTMLLIIKDEKGEEVARKLVGVGALTREQVRTFSLSVQVSDPTN